MADTTSTTTYDCYIDSYEPCASPHVWERKASEVQLLTGSFAVYDTTHYPISYLDFNVTLPTGATVTKVELIINTEDSTLYGLYGVNTFNYDCDFKIISVVVEDWTDNNDSNGDLWNAWDGFETMAAADVSGLGSHTIELTSYAIDAVQANKQLSIGIKPSYQSDVVLIKFSSLECTTSANRPQLKVTYTEASGRRRIIIC